MRIGIALEIDSSIGHLSAAVRSIEASLNECFCDRDYGSGVDYIFIGLNLTHPDTSRLHPIRSLKYKKLVKFKNLVTGMPTEMKNVIEYDVRPSFEIVGSMNENDALRFLATTLADSLSVLEGQHSLFPNFDLHQFRIDFSACFSLLGPDDNKARAIH